MNTRKYSSLRKVEVWEEIWVCKRMKSVKRLEIYFVLKGRRRPLAGREEFGKSIRVRMMIERER